MSYQPKVYTLGHTLGLTAMVLVGTFACYQKGTQSEDAGMRWFTENWLLYIGGGVAVLTFLYSLGRIGTPCYDEETNKQLEAEHNQAEFEWNTKSPEERAIITAARENGLFQLTQIMQNDRIIRNQELIKRKLRD